LHGRHNVCDLYSLAGTNVDLLPRLIERSQGYDCPGGVIHVNEVTPFLTAIVQDKWSI